jgi:hypothetical protein
MLEGWSSLPIGRLYVNDGSVTHSAGIGEINAITHPLAPATIILEHHQTVYSLLTLMVAITVTFAGLYLTILIGHGLVTLASRKDANTKAPPTTPESFDSQTPATPARLSEEGPL